MNIQIFYGFSGSPNQPAPEFPDGQDLDKSFELVAKTIGDSVQRLFPSATIAVTQAWTKDVIINELESSSSPIDQVHVVSHGDATGVSLAYHYDQNMRLASNVIYFEGVTDSDDDKAMAALLSEDALLAGLFSRGLESSEIASIKSNLAPDATWQLWGCWSGEATTTFGHIPFPASATPSQILWVNRINAYFKRFNFGQSSVPGIAVDIAKGLGITCTAALNGWGLSFWHGNPDRTFERNGLTTPAQKPFWLWNTPGSRFVSYGPDGSALPQPSIFGTSRTSTEIAGGPPPKWLRDLYWGP